ncbi:MAG TPA: DinB family protein [Gemmatimonadaceae bacterium]|nr:DinB family protein [Gemmatimonadaceae bacterium]
MLLAQLRRLFEHAEWANTQVLVALEREPNVAGDIVELFAHVLGAEEVWLSRLEGRAPALAVWPALPLGELVQAARATALGYRRYIDRLTPDDLAREVAYRNSAGQAFTSTIADILTHVAMHGSYHRGQVALRIRRDGGTPAPTDFIAFVRGVPAATRTSSL